MTTGFVTQSESALRDAAAVAVAHATAVGADGASATAHAGGGVRIVVREGVAETALRDAYQSLELTVFRGGRSGSASTAALDTGSIRRAVEEAYAIAGLVQPDPMAGLADPDTLAIEGEAPPTFAPSGKSPGDLLDMALEIDTLAGDYPVPSDVTVRVTEAGVASDESMMALATSGGFCRSAAFSSHGRWAMVLAKRADGSVQDYAQSSDRCVGQLRDAADVANDAVARTIAQLDARPLSSRRATVLFDARVAAAVVGDLVGALSGGPQYQRASFLLDALGRQVAAPHIDLVEDPYEPFGMASGGFDGEGVAGTARRIVSGGEAQGYFLGTTSARRLGMRSTGNAGGPWNLRLTSRVPGGDAAALRATMGTGLVVTQLLGGATDPVTGTWTRAVGGFWIEGGNIVHPVIDVTLGGRMTDMLNAIITIGDDVERSGAIRSGSILIEHMQIGGAA